MLLGSMTEALMVRLFHRSCLNCMLERCQVGVLLLSYNLLDSSFMPLP